MKEFSRHFIRVKEGVYCGLLSAITPTVPPDEE
jgi:hypothetical protein